MQAGRRPNQASSKNKGGNGSDRTRKGVPDATEVVRRRKQLDEDDDEDDPLINARNHSKTKRRQVIPDEEDEFGDESEEHDKDEGTVARTQVNSAATTTQLPLAPRNRRPESEQQTNQNEELQDKYQNVSRMLIMSLF
jgi:hypothetical protein